MIRIAYGVNGVGLGHATASKRVIDDLLEANPGLEVLIFSSMAALDFFRGVYAGEPRIRVEEVWGIDSQMRKGEVSILKTALGILPHLGRKEERIGQLRARLLEEGIRLVINDFEHYSPRAARRADIPVIAFSHSLFLRFLDLNPLALPSEWRADYLVAKGTVRCLYPLGQSNIVNTFYPFPHREADNVAFLGPILTREVIAAQALVADGDFILVYPKTPNEALFLEFIQGLSHLDFVFYARQPERFQDTPNIKFKPYCAEGFMQDLAHCSLAFSNAGHQLPCEALFLKKPMIVVPEGRQFEQYYNGQRLQEMGLGISIPLRGMRPKVIADFWNRLDLYRERVSKAAISDATPLALRIVQRELSGRG